MPKKLFSPVLLIGSVFFVFMNSPSLALQSGGVEIGDLETGSVVGQPFETLDVDLMITGLCVGGRKAWYPPTSILDLRNQGADGRASGPIIIKITNTLPLPQGFSFSADSPFAGPTSMSIKMVLKAQETKYIGIPMSDFTYVTTGGLILYGSHMDPAMLGGHLVILR